MSDFQQKTTQAFAEGLTSNEWWVEIATASVQAPGALTHHQLLLLGSPIYASAANPLRHYVRRLSDLHGQPTVVLLTGAGDSDKAETAMKNLVIKMVCVPRTIQTGQGARADYEPSEPNTIL